MDITYRIKVVKTDTPKGGYCGCFACKAGVLASYRNSGDKVDGITRKPGINWFEFYRQKAWGV